MKMARPHRRNTDYIKLINDEEERELKWPSLGVPIDMTITKLNIADGTVGRTRFPRVKKRCLIFAIVLIIIVVGIIFAYYHGLFSKKNEDEELQPPNPVKALPASSSLLHVFKKAAVCADSVPCAKIGKSILEDGGNAVDAAIAALFCNSMVNMQSMGLGGGFLMTIYIRKDKKAYVLNARETAPSSADPEMYRDDPYLSRNGPLAVAVPGELRGYHAAHQRFGKLEWAKLIQPTIDLCDQGYNMSKHQHDSLYKNKIQTSDTNIRDWFVDAKGNFKSAGSLIKPKKFCDTLRLIAKNGADDLYNGTLGEMFLEDLNATGSLITKEDLESYQPVWMEPISLQLNNNQVLHSVPPPGSGAILAFILNILNEFKFKPENIQEQEIQSTVQTYHKIIEAFKHAFAKRTLLGDISFVDITNLLTDLTSPEYAARIRAKIKDNSTSTDPKDYEAIYYSEEDHGTAHISVLSEEGDAVSVTSSINLYFGAGFTSKQTGIILNSQMDDFSFPYFKNYFGLLGSPNNALQPGKRPMSSMSPSIVVDDRDNVKLVIGASGGTKIITSVALVIMRTLWFRQNIKEAVDAPRFHHQLYPMEVQYEFGTLQQVIDGLEALGHKTNRYKDAGSMICALLNETEKIYANADYRKGGDVFGID